MVALLDNRLYIHRSRRVGGRPCQTLAGAVGGSLHYFSHNGVIQIVDNGLCIVKENELLTAFVLTPVKVLVVGCSKICQYCYRGLDDVTQGQHLSRLAYSCLEHSHLCVGVHEPYAQRDSYLGIVAAG